MNYQTAVVQLPLVRESAAKRRVVTPRDIHDVVGDLGELAQESFQVITLNTKNDLVNRHLVTLGLADASLVHAREVFRPAISDGAAAVVLVHNHPSGDPTPSAADIRITKELVKAGEILDIRVLDHVIIGSGETPFFSIREAGLVSF